MAKKNVTSKKTRATAPAVRAPAVKKSTTKKKTTTTRKSKTTRKPTAKVVKKPVKKKTAKAPGAAATTSPRKKPTAAKADAGSPKTISKGTSRKTTARSRSRSGASVRPLPDANGYVIINGRRVRMMSVPAEVAPPPVRKSRSRKPDPDPEPVGTSRKTVVKTKLGRKDLDNYRTQLLIRRAELVGDLSAMEANALRSGGGNPSHMPIHMADVGSDTFDQDFMLGMAENERQRLREIDAALKRIEDKTYGICDMTHKVIPKSRLNAKPWARYTIESAREVERGLGE